jgi:hypothetical protein
VKANLPSRTFVPTLGAGGFAAAGFAAAGFAAAGFAAAGFAAAGFAAATGSFASAVTDATSFVVSSPPPLTAPKKPITATRPTGMMTRFLVYQARVDCCGPT